jgi:hypothetical protein
MNYLYWYRAVLAGAMLLSFTSLAETVGKVFLLKGDAVSFTDADPKEIKVLQNAPVQSKDVLRTGPKSNLEIGFLDATSCKLGPSTELSIEEYKFVRGQQNSSFKATLKKGKASFATGKMVTENPENFKITTPSATVGVRGCLFDLNQEEPDRLVINVMEVGKTNGASIFVTTLGGIKYEFSAAGLIVIQNNQIINPGPAIQTQSPFVPMLPANIPVNNIIQLDKPPVHVDPYTNPY